MFVEFLRMCAYVVCSIRGERVKGDLETCYRADFPTILNTTRRETVGNEVCIGRIIRSNKYRAGKQLEGDN